MAALTPSVSEDSASSVFRSTVVYNAFSLYVGQAAMYVVPIVTIPYLARVFGVAEWGKYSFALALSTQLALLVEYGFGVSANREIAKHRADPRAIGSTLGGVIVAKLALAALACCIAVIAYACISSLQQRPALFWAAVAAGITQGASFAWFLYGLEKIALAAGMDIVSRISVAVSTFVLVTTPNDAWIYFLLQTIANILVLGVGLAYVVRDHTIIWPRITRVGPTLRHGLSVTLTRPGFGLFTGLNTFLLGLYANSAVVGQYAGAERMTRALTALPGPMCQALFPRITHLLTTDPSKSSRLRILGGWATVLLGLILSASTYVLAPIITRLFLGAGYDDSATILRILSPVPFIAAINQVLLYHYLFPDGAFNYSALSFAGTTGVVLAAVAILGLGRNPRALAAAAGVAEAGALLCLVVRVRWGGVRAVATARV